MSDLLKRSLHTFWQTGLVVFLGGITNVINAFQGSGLDAGKSALLALLLGAVAAGFSAVKTAVAQYRAS